MERWLVTVKLFFTLTGRLNSEVRRHYVSVSKKTPGFTKTFKWMQWKLSSIQRPNKVSSYQVWCGLTILLSQSNTLLLSKESCSPPLLPPHFLTPFLLKALRLFWPNGESVQGTNPWRNFFFVLVKISFQIRTQRLNLQCRRKECRAGKGDRKQNCI